MSEVSINKSWRIFFETLKEEHWWSLAVAAEWMYRLNVFARSIGRHVLADQIYELKNHFIQYLYQHGYSYEVKMDSQKQECWSCDGTGEWWTGYTCHKCNGTGVYRRTELYAFRFNIEGKRYAWHQLKRLVDYPVTLTDGQSGLFAEAPKDAAILTLAEAWRGCCVLWWCLAVHGVFSPLIMFYATWFMIKKKLGVTPITIWVIKNKLAKQRARLRTWWVYDTPWARWQQSRFKRSMPEDDYGVDTGEDEWDEREEWLDRNISHSYEPEFDE